MNIVGHDKEFEVSVVEVEKVYAGKNMIVELVKKSHVSYYNIIITREEELDGTYRGYVESVLHSLSKPSIVENNGRKFLSLDRFVDGEIYPSLFEILER